MDAVGKARNAGRRFSLFATESRPMLEGHTVAAHAAKLGIPVTLVADAAAALIMDRIDVVLVGADRVTSRSLINKIGTRMIALAARERGRPVYAICDTSKFDRRAEIQTPLAERNPSELWPGAPQDVKVLNVYFEETPLDLITGIITEDGIRSR